MPEVEDGKVIFAADPNETKFRPYQLWLSEGDREYEICSVQVGFTNAPIIARRMTVGFRFGLPVAFDLNGRQIDGGATLVKLIQ